MYLSTGSGGGIVPRVLHPAHGGLRSVRIFGAQWPAVLVVAVSCSEVLVAAVSCSAVLVAAVSFSSVLVAAVSLAAVLVVVAVVSLAAVLVAAVSLAAVLVAAVSLAAVLVAAVSLAAVLVVVLSTMQVFPDLPVLVCPIPTLDSGAAGSTLPPVPLGAALFEDFFPLSRRELANLLCFSGGGLSVLWLLGTLAALLPGALQKPVTTGTTAPAGVVAEALGRDLEMRALGD
ncbi:hypothetical protein NDU88_008374 [Pleurodeles waltl]|uniref:Uncharacterized protein n=1 Tax=Pleurodeles waltl TaxID=8319 RepID=A0AAV7RXH5_PLEWA|nr:hypothetical protein NDU88_008374 [Pleurodeles waltl]